MTDHEQNPDHLHAEIIQLRQRVAELEVARNEYRSEALLLVEELHQWRTMLETSQDGIVITDYDGKVIMVNQTFADMLGYSADEMADLHIWDWDFQLLPEEVSKLSVSNRGKSFKVETRHRRKDGTVYDCEISSNWIIWNGKPAALNIVRDISERNAAVKAVKASEARLKKAVELAQLGVWDWDLKTDRAEWFGQMFSILGVEPNEFSGRGSEYQEMTGDSTSSGTTGVEKVIVMPDGSERTILSDSVQMNNDLGEPARMMGIVLDITERKRLLAAQENSQARYDLLMKYMGDVIWVLNVPRAKFTYVSPSVERLRGFTAEEVLAQGLAEAVTPDSLIQVGELLAKRIPQFLADPSQVMYLVDLVDQPHKDGSIVHTEVNTTMTINKLGELEVIGVSRDISQRLAAENKVLGLLAEKEDLLREVHHRVRNNMSTISSLLALQAASLEESAAVEALTDAAGRVQMMMTIYNLLYTSGDYEMVNLQTFVANLVRDLASSASNPAPMVTIRQDVEELKIYTRQAFSLGIVISELIGNALKFAYGENDTGEIEVRAQAVAGQTVSAQAAAENSLEVWIINDGAPFPLDVDLSTPRPVLACAWCG